RLDLFRAQRGRRVHDHALRLAAAEPQPAVRIEIAEVAHAVHDALAAVRAGFPDLGQARLHVAVVVGVGGAGAGHGDLADFAGRQPQLVAPFGDGVVL